MSAKIMKRMSARKTASVDRDSLRREYRFDYRRSRPNRFARAAREGVIAVVLEPDVGVRFRSSEAVNALLRSVISALPSEKRSRSRSRRKASDRKLCVPIVVRAKSEADARRIVAAINGVRGIPTEALETWMVKDVSDPDYRPNDLDVTFYDETALSPHAVPPPGEPSPTDAAPIADPLPFDRRIMERRQGRGGQIGAVDESLAKWFVSGPTSTKRIIMNIAQLSRRA
jgi:hypothetical protein